MQNLAVIGLAMTLLGCASAKTQDASDEEKRAYLFASVAKQTATGRRDCRHYADGLSARLAHSPYRYDVQPLYYCSLGAECHVLLRVGTGEAQFVADNGAFIKGHVEPLSVFQRQMTARVSWRQVQPRDARLLMMAERYGLP